MGGGEIKVDSLLQNTGGYFETSFNVPPRYAEPSFNLPPGTLKLVSTYPGGNLKLGEVTLNWPFFSFSVSAYPPVCWKGGTLKRLHRVGWSI